MEKMVDENQNSNNIKVSVIVPIYNVEKYLARCLESIINQTLKEIEIICINDGSTDGSAEILQQYAQKDERIIVINQQNQGMSSARNNGLSIASGEFIGFVDSDDFIELNFYEKLYNTAKEKDADVACAGIIRENSKKSKKLITYEKVETKTNIKEKFELAKAPQYCFVWNKIYSSKLLKGKKIRFIDGIYYEDMPYTVDILSVANKVVCVPNVFYYYWKNPNSIIKTETDKTRADKLFAKKYIIKKCFEYGIRLFEKESLISKKIYYFLGIPILKLYQYRATKKYYLFSVIPFFEVRENV